LKQDPLMSRTREADRRPVWLYQCFELVIMVQLSDWNVNRPEQGFGPNKQPSDREGGWVWFAPAIERGTKGIFVANYIGRGLRGAERGPVFFKKLLVLKYRKKNIIATSFGIASVGRSSPKCSIPMDSISQFNAFRITRS
jgi:hypothetical protein